MPDVVVVLQPPKGILGRYLVIVWREFRTKLREVAFHIGKGNQSRSPGFHPLQGVDEEKGLVRLDLALHSRNP